MPNGSTSIPANPPSDAGLTLTTLGQSPRLARGDEAVLGPGKPLALVVYLSVADGHAATREFLLDLLWSDLEPERARHALRQTLWYIRSTFGDSFIFGREELTLGPKLDTDRGRFLAAVAAGDPEAAVQAYTGEFLPDFALPGSTEFEHWAFVERSRLRATFVRAGEMVVRRRLAAGRARDAQQVARRVRDADRLNETGWRLVLEALIAGRDFVQAAIEADALITTFKAEGRSLEPATRRLVTEAERDPEQTVELANGGPPELVADLIGRETEFATILDAWQRVRRGPAEHFHLVAPAGFGKSRLLADIAHRLTTSGAKTLRLRANPGDRAVSSSFAGDLASALGSLPGLAAVSPATADALVDLSPALSARFPVAKPLSARYETVRRRTSALAEAVITVAEEQPIAVLIDDVHWLDGESHQILQGLLARLNHAPVLVVTSGRPIGERTLESPVTATLPLPALCRPAIASLVTSLGRWPETGGLDEVAGCLEDATGGSPLLVLEALQLALERSTLTLADGGWRCPDQPRLLVELGRGSALRLRVESLDTEAAWVLLVLATAGTPLTPNELGAAVRHPDSLPDQLWNLERHGFVRREGSSWNAAHDEIAATCLEAETTERRQAANAAVARALLQDSGALPGALIRAARHGAAAGDAGLLQLAYRRLVSAARQFGDTRSPLALAIDAAGGDPTSPTPRRLVRALPWRTRWGLESPLRLAVALGGPLAAAVLMAFVIRSRDPGPHGPTLIAFAANQKTTSAFVVSIPTDYQGLDTLRAFTPAAMSGLGPKIRVSGAASNGRVWVGYFHSGTELTQEVVLGAGISFVTVASSPRDDGSPSLSPDGRLIAFSTARWTPPGDDDADIAIYDIASRAVRQLTSGRAVDGVPKWSRDGTRIAFTRRHFGGQAEACWVTVDGTRERCVKPDNLIELVGWVSTTEVLAMQDGRDHRTLVEINLDTGTWHPLNSPDPVVADVSPDGHWVACQCRSRDSDAGSWMLFRVDAPEFQLPVKAALPIQGLAWVGARDGPGPVSRLTIAGSDRPIPIGGTYRLRAKGLDSTGAPVEVAPAVLRWWSADTTIARVDSASGDIRAIRPGGTRITVAAGMATAASELTVVAATVESVRLDERWRDSVEARWRYFGIPRPLVAIGPDGAAGFLNNGDGSYPSGAYTRQGFTARNGLGFQARVSLPITRDHWQVLSLTLVDEASFENAATWDHQSGAPPFEGGVGDFNCGVGLGGEGPFAKERVSVHSRDRSRILTVPRGFYDGRWRTIRIQILPDGSCGVALDGVPRWRLRGTLVTDHRYRLVISGQSAGTKLLVGPTDIWEGAGRDIDWDALP